jgi:hypothetical protein
MHSLSKLQHYSDKITSIVTSCHIYDIPLRRAEIELREISTCDAQILVDSSTLQHISGRTSPACRKLSPRAADMAIRQAAWRYALHFAVSHPTMVQIMVHTR